MWQLAVGEEASDWSQDSEPQEEPLQEEKGPLMPARLWPEDDTEPVVYHHAGYRYKRTIEPARVVVGYVGDFGRDVPYHTRGEMMQAVRASISFCEQWLHHFVLRGHLPHTFRLRRNLRLHTRERQYGDLLEYERYLRWNVEYRFNRVALREVGSALMGTPMPLDLINIVIAYSL